MPDREIAQLVLQVDANIAVAQRELQNLARAVRQNTGDINNALDSTTPHAVKMAGGFNQARIAQMELSHVVTASVDAYAAGFSPIRIMTLEMGRLAEAATFLGGSGGGGVLGKLAGFMGGPWGIAVLIGVNVLTQLITKHQETGESIDELIKKMEKEAKQASLSKEATAAWLRTYDGAAANIDKVVDALDGENRTLEQNIALKQGQLKANIATLEQQRSDLIKQLQDQQQRLGVLHGPATGGFSDPQSTRKEIDKTAAAIGALGSQIDVVDSKIAKARRGVVEAALPAIEKQAKALADPLEAVSQQYAELRKDAEQVAGAIAQGVAQPVDAVHKLQEAFAAAGLKIPHALRDTLAALDKMEEKARKAIEAAKKGNAEFGKQIGFADAEAIAKAAGLTVTSGYRSTAHQAELYNDPSVRRPGNPVAVPGTSAHEGVNGKWALDIAFAPGLTADSLKKLYGGQGVTLSAVYKEKGHFHIEGSRSQAAADEAAAKRAEISGIHQQGAFDQASDRLDQELEQAKQQLTGDYHTQAVIAAKQVDAETKKLLDSIQEQEEIGKATGYQQGITAAQGNILIAKAHELDAAKKAAIAQREIEQQARDAQSLSDQKYQFQIDDLHFADEMATTQGEHRKLQLDIIDIVYQQKELDLEYAKAQAERNQNLAEANRIQAQIDQLPTEKAQDQSRARQGTLDPLDAWAKSVPKTAAEINQALQSIEVQGIDNLADAIAGVVTGTESLGKAFKNIANEIIADIVRMTIRMLIFKAISSIFGGGGISSSSFNSIAGATGIGGGLLPGLATGGIIDIGGKGGVDQNVLSINGTPRAMVGADEKLAVIPKASRISIPAGAANSNEPIELIIHSAPSPDAWAQVDHISATRAGEAVKVSVNHTNNTLRSLARPGLMGR